MTRRPAARSNPSLVARASALWGVGGVAVMLLQAIVRLTPIARAAVEQLHGAGLWAVLVTWVALNGYAEGYRGFHQRFSPRVVARALYLMHHPTWTRALLAPAFCMSLFGASRRGMLVSRGILVGVTALVATMRWIGQPWRGIVDAGVVAGLGIGLASIVYFAVRLALGHPPPVDADVPHAPPRASP